MLLAASTSEHSTSSKDVPRKISEEISTGNKVVLIKPKLNCNAGDIVVFENG